MLPISLGKTDLVVSNWCFLAFFIFFPMLTLGSKDFLEAAGSEAAVARLNSACHLVRRRVGAEAISMSFTEKELWHFKWKLSKKCEWWSAICLCWGATHLPKSDQDTHAQDSSHSVLPENTQSLCQTFSLAEQSHRCYRLAETPKMQNTKADIHNESKVLIEHL